MQELITKAAAESRLIPDPQRQINEFTLRLRNQFIDRQLAAMSLDANQTGITDDERVGLLRRQKELRELKRQPLAPINGKEEAPL